MSDYILQAERLSAGRLHAEAMYLYRTLLDHVGIEYFLEFGFNFEDMYRYVIKPMTGITIEEHCELGTDPATGLRLGGTFDAKSRIARIDASLSEVKNDPRRVFTLWHEVVGHGWLQTRWMEEQAKQAASEGAKAITIPPSTERILEWQANMLAGLAAVPTPLMEATLCYVLNLQTPIPYVGPREYWLEHSGVRRRVWVRSFDHLCLCLADRVKRYFVGLSSTAIAIRIASSRWVVKMSDASKKARSLQIMDCDLPEALANRHN